MPCLTPVRSPESNGVSEAFVRNPRAQLRAHTASAGALAVLQQPPAWINDYNDNHPHSGLRMRSPREFIHAQSQRASCSVRWGQLHWITWQKAELWLQCRLEPAR
ncbi:integrase core domain-containing protein [Lichenicoccus roseus]|uniref:Integrase catalytic domain-containing protein n=1 Tax=Lichenicoccus roseus TaxID=2683649 RepID=A0A5R9J4J8_9PROT|nr:hypothetical protein FE263_21440 [Lichenicoccus roseus]